MSGRHPPGQTPPRQKPPGQKPPRADTPWADPPPEQIPPWADTPWADTPRQTPPWADPPVWQTATAADGTHSTGMHSCSDCNKKNKGHGIKTLCVDRPLCIVYIHSLPPANEVCKGYVFTPVCHSVHGGMSGRQPPNRPLADTP